MMASRRFACASAHARARARAEVVRTDEYDTLTRDDMVTLAQIESGSPSPLFLVERLCMSTAVELDW